MRDTWFGRNSDFASRVSPLVIRVGLSRLGVVAKNLLERSLTIEVDDGDSPIGLKVLLEVAKYEVG